MANTRHSSTGSANNSNSNNQPQVTMDVASVVAFLQGSPELLRRFLAEEERKKKEKEKEASTSAKTKSPAKKKEAKKQEPRRAETKEREAKKKWVPPSLAMDQ